MNYGNIAKAVEFYTGRGYTYTDFAPWVVSADAYNATKPYGAVDTTVQGATPGFLVASGEQSFLQMMLDGQPLKRAICVTPCFRAEKYDALHKPYFMKAELINAHDVDQGHLMHMVHDACSFFEQWLSVRIVEIGDAFDIVEKGTRIELGSYGIRERDINGKRYRWIYGTACAEPRLSRVIAGHSGVVGR